MTLAWQPAVKQACHFVSFVCVCVGGWGSVKCILSGDMQVGQCQILYCEEYSEGDCDSLKPCSICCTRLLCCVVVNWFVLKLCWVGKCGR